MSNSSFHTVTIVGATGNVGYAIAEAFLNYGSYNVKILRRKSDENEKSKSLASKGAEIVYADYSQKDDLVKVLKGTDVVVSAVYDITGNTSTYDIQIPLLAAAKEASVKRFIPSEFSIAYKCVNCNFF
jgi:putative NADH-flavin reductase